MKYSLKDMLYLMRLRGTSTNNESDNSGEESGSGSSSGSAANVMIVKPVEKHRTTRKGHYGSSGPDTLLNVTRRVIYDKTWQEVHDALAAGTQVFIDLGFLMENRIEDTFMHNSDYNIDDLYARLFRDLLYVQASNNEQPATLYPITGTFVRSTAYGEINTETDGVRYGKEYTIDLVTSPEISFGLYVTDNSSDGAIYCEPVISYDIPSDYNSELDEQYDQWLNEGNNSDNPEL